MLCLLLRLMMTSVNNWVVLSCTYHEAVGQYRLWGIFSNFITCKGFDIFSGIVYRFICGLNYIEHEWFCLFDNTVLLLIKKPGIYVWILVLWRCTSIAISIPKICIIEIGFIWLYPYRWGHPMQLCGYLGNMCTVIKHSITLAKFLWILMWYLEMFIFN